MGFFISTNGRVYIEGTDHPKYDLESIGILNWFNTRMLATTIRDIIEEYNPMAFYTH